MSINVKWRHPRHRFWKPFVPKVLASRPFAGELRLENLDDALRLKTFVRLRVLGLIPGNNAHCLLKVVSEGQRLNSFLQKGEVHALRRAAADRREVTQSFLHLRKHRRRFGTSPHAWNGLLDLGLQQTGIPTPSLTLDEKTPR